MSVQDVVDVFARIMNIIESDKVIQIQEDNEVHRWKWKKIINYINILKE